MTCRPRESADRNFGDAQTFFDSADLHFYSPSEAAVTHVQLPEGVRSNGALRAKVGEAMPPKNP